MFINLSLPVISTTLAYCLLEYQLQEMADEDLSLLCVTCEVIIHPKHFWHHSLLTIISILVLRGMWVTGKAVQCQRSVSSHCTSVLRGTTLTRTRPTFQARPYHTCLPKNKDFLVHPGLRNHSKKYRGLSEQRWVEKYRFLYSKDRENSKEICVLCSGTRQSFGFDTIAFKVSGLNSEKTQCMPY